MPYFTFNQITMTLLITCVAFGIAGIATSKWQGNGSIFNLQNEGNDMAVKVLVLAGTVGACVALLVQVLINVSSQFAVSRAVQLICLIFVLIGVGGLLVGVLVYGVSSNSGCSNASNCGYSYWFSVISAVLIFEASIFYFIAWRCP